MDNLQTRLQGNSNEGKDIDFEDKLWKAADKLRKKIEVHEYKYIVLGLVFLRYLSFSFELRRKELENMLSDPKSKEYVQSVEFRNQALDDKDFYLERGVLYVPIESRWGHLVKNATQPRIGEIIDRAVETLENEYPRQLKDVVPKNYAGSNLDALDLAYLINLFSSVQPESSNATDVFGRVYEYFLGKFAEAEGKKGGEFYTPRSLTRLIVETLDVKPGRVFDPACGSGGFFVAALEKLQREGHDRSELTISGQESKVMPWKICKMNLALRGAEGDIRTGDSYHDDKFPDLKADYVMANPPFNDSGWGAERVKYDDPRFEGFGVPPNNNANYVWILHFIRHTAQNGRAGFVMANGALSGSNTEGEIRKKIIEADLVWGVVACPPKLFYNVGLPVSVWFVRRTKPSHMRGKVLFIYARRTYKEISRKQVVLTSEHVARIVQKFGTLESNGPDTEINEAGFAKIATTAEIAKNGYVLTPGRYVGIRPELDEVPADERIREYSARLMGLLNDEEELASRLKEVLRAMK